MGNACVFVWQAYYGKYALLIPSVVWHWFSMKMDVHVSSLFVQMEYFTENSHKLN